MNALYEWLLKIRLDVKIKQRMLVTALILGIISVSTPLYLRKQLAELSYTYDWASTNWHDLEMIKDYSRLLTDAELRLRAYSTSQNKDWLLELKGSNSKMRKIVEELKEHHRQDTKAFGLLDQIWTEHVKWEQVILNPAFGIESQQDFAKFASNLIFEPIAFGILRNFDDFTQIVRTNNDMAQNKISDLGKRTRKILTFNALAFFLIFSSFMFSLWMRIVPDLAQLLEGAEQLKEGNLSHRVQIGGHTETAKLGSAFNEMAASLQEQNVKLQELNRLKTDFVSTVSHELRTPLTAIKGSIDLILGGITGELPEDGKKMLQITKKNTDRLIRLINEILDVSKIEAGAIKLNFKKYSICDVIQHSLDMISVYAGNNHIRLVWMKPDRDPNVVMDKDRIVQVLTNLLSNAIKFTPHGGTITVSAELGVDKVVVHVNDTGSGIPPEFLEKIFQKFQQVEPSSTKSKEGTGLGLTIAKALIEEHKGQIWVHSQAGVGSTFSFTLPWNGRDFATPTPASAAA